MKKFSLAFIFCFTAFLGQAATYYSTGSGEFTTTAIWGTTTNGTGALWSAITLADGDTLIIDDDVEISSTDLTINEDIVIILRAQVELVKKVYLTENTIIKFDSSGEIIANGPGNSEKIFFGSGAAVWSGNDGDVEGPGVMDINYVGVLPVELISFVASQESNQVNLSWSTASEENFDRFVIERAAGFGDFEDIGFVYGQNEDSYEINEYHFSDEQPTSGLTYYRLKSLDLDGTFEYSDIRVIKVEGISWLDVYPNPVSEGLVTLSSSSSKEKLVVIRDAQGVIVLEADINQYIQELNIEHLKSGLYVLSVFDGGWISKTIHVK